MAKSKDEINKSQAIREALRAHRDKTPIEIAEMLTAKGVEVNAQYVSTIKSNMRKNVSSRAQGAARDSAGGRKSSLNGTTQFGNGLQVINAAVELVKVAGGIEQAKSALSTVEEIGKAMK